MIWHEVLSLAERHHLSAYDAAHRELAMRWGLPLASHDGATAEEAQRIIEGLTRRVSQGEMFSSSVNRVIPIGAFMESLPGKEGMIQISQLSEARAEKVEAMVNVGDQVTVQVREIDNRGRIDLTLRGVPQQEPVSV